MDNIYDEVYQRLAVLPEDQRAALLKELLPPQELFMRMDGTAFAVHKFGLRLFEAKALLGEIGIPEDDPRSIIYRKLVGSKINEDVPKSLRAIAAKEETVGKNAGAVQIWDQGSKIWWVPIAATQKFQNSMQSLLDEFDDLVQRELIDGYNDMLDDAKNRFLEATQTAWDDMNVLGRIDMPRDEYIKKSMGAFEARFPTISEIREKVRMELTPRQAPLPQHVENILTDVREAAKQKIKAEAEAANLAVKTNQVQLRMVQLEEQLKEVELNKLEDERNLRREIIKSQIAPEIQRAEEIVLQVEMSLMRVAQEIVESAKKGTTITSATRRSWNQRLKRLKELSPENPEFDRALEELAHMSTADKVTAQNVNVVSENVMSALREMERVASMEINADAIWRLMQGGHGEQALKAIQNIRDKATTRLNEVEALHELIILTGVNNTPDDI
jgi:hypothetical protein